MTAVARLVVLEIFGGSDFWLYQWFETAVVRLYWALVFPLAALFDWGRGMFKRGKAIREAKKEEIREKAIREGEKQGTEEENKRIRKLLEQHGVELSEEVTAAVFGKSLEDDP